jgi:hypothetical protein
MVIIVIIEDASPPLGINFAHRATVRDGTFQDWRFALGSERILRCRPVEDSTIGPMRTRASMLAG